MHEMSIAEGIIQVLEDAAQAQGFSRVSSLWVEVGQLSGVEPESLAFCFDAVSRGTLAEGAKLELLITPGQGHCLECHQDTPLAAVFDPCQHCGAVPVQVTGGTDMKVKELMVEDGEPS